jgi:hypothetical protein
MMVMDTAFARAVATVWAHTVSVTQTALDWTPAVDKSIVVPIGLFVAVVYTIKLLVEARMRYLFFKGDAPETVEALYRAEERTRRMAALRWGLVLLSLAAGLAVADAKGWQPLSLPALAVLMAALGLGNLASFAAALLLEKRPT